MSKAINWNHFPALHAKLTPPLRPAPSDVAAFGDAIAGYDGEVLLLGMTPELAELGQSLTAVDSCQPIIDAIWPGDGPTRRAVNGNWTALPFADASFDSVIGDGSLNCVPDCVPAVLAEIRRVLRPGGIAAMRLFASPDPPDDLAAINADALAGRIGNAQALRWRIGMARGFGRPNFALPATDILVTFNRLFPDRAALTQATGWEASQIDSFDDYIDTTHWLGFPPVAAMLDWARPYFDSAEVRASTGYPLAERCPLAVWTR